MMLAITSTAYKLNVVQSFHIYRHQRDGGLVLRLSTLLNDSTNPPNVTGHTIIKEVTGLSVIYNVQSACGRARLVLVMYAETTPPELNKQ